MRLSSLTKCVLVCSIICLLTSNAFSQISIRPFQKGVKLPPAQAFNPRDSNGKSINADTLADKIVLFHTWKTDKEVLKKEYSVILQNAYRTYARAGLIFYNVSMDKDAKQAKINARAAGFRWDTICDGHGPDLVKGTQAGTIVPSMGFYFSGKNLPKAYLFKEGICIWSGSIDGVDAALQAAFPDIKMKPKDGKGSGDEPEQATESVDDALRVIEEAMGKIDLDKDFAGALKNIELIDDKVLSSPLVIRKAIPLILALKPIGNDKTSIKLAIRENEKAKVKLQRLTTSAVALLAMPIESVATTNNNNSPNKPTNPRELIARRRLEQAIKEKANGDDYEAYRILRDLRKRYATTKAGEDSKLMIEEYEENKEFVTAFKKEERERTATSRLKLAEGYAKTNQTQLAKRTYEDVIDTYPDTQAAIQAKEAIKKLK